MLDFRSRKRRAFPDGGVAHAAKKAAAAVLEAVSPEGSPQKHPVAAFAKNTVRVDPVVKVCGAYGASPRNPPSHAREFPKGSVQLSPSLRSRDRSIPHFRVLLSIVNR